MRGGQFSLTIVRLSMDLVLQTGASLRSAAAGLRLIATRLGLGVAMPSFGAVRSWLLRLGCYALLCPLPSGGWVWLVDHTVQIGAHKLLVIVGCPLANVPFGDRPLRQSDLHLVGLSLMEHSTKEAVAAELEKAALRTGIPREIASGFRPRNDIKQSYNFARFNIWGGARVVEWDSLENYCGLRSTEGSNPSLSADDPKGF